KEVREHHRVDSRHRDVRPDAENDERPEQKEQAPLEVAVLRSLADAGKSGRHQLFCSPSAACGSAFFAFFSFFFFGSSAGFSAISTLPPVFSMAARAPLLAFTSCLRVSLRASSPERITFAPSTSCGTTFSAFSAARSISVACIACRSLRRTSATASRESEVKPRLGRRRCSGIWPPSKPSLWKPPERARCPLCPRPAVLPQPEPTPRPTRWRSFFEPSAGLRSFSFISRS